MRPRETRRARHRREIDRLTQRFAQQADGPADAEIAKTQPVPGFIMPAIMPLPGLVESGLGQCAQPILEIAIRPAMGAQQTGGFMREPAR